MHEKDNYLKTAELSTEQNCNMIDGVPNNTPIPPTPPELDAKPLDKVKEPKERRMENRKRNVHLHVMVTPDELAAIYERMAEAGISNAGAYVRKMALNGYILHIDLAPVKELISLQRRCSNNLNQVAIHAHTYGVYPEEIDGLKRDYEKLWGEVSKVLRELSELVAK